MIGERLVPDPRVTPTIDVPWAARLLGCSSWTAYKMIERGDFPVPVLRTGRKIRVPSAPMLEALGLREGRG